MIKKNYPVKSLLVEREEGLEIDGVEMGGTGIYDAEAQEFKFMKTPKRQKSAPKNPALYAGDYATLRLQQNGSHRITIMIHANTLVSEIESQIIKELKECLKKLQ